MVNINKTISFSIVIILYNQKKYVGECIQSVLDQTYPFHEVIIVNDGSTDGGDAYVREWESKYPDLIKVYNQENAGAFAARATGMKHVTGDYFIVIDSDDTIRQDTLELIAENVVAISPDIVLINMSNVADYSNPMLDYKSIGIEANKDGIVTRDNYLTALSSSCAINMMAMKMYSSHLIDIDEIDKYGIGVKMGEDRIHSLMLSDKAKSIALLNQPLYYYRPNPNSACHVYNPYYVDSVVKYCQVSRIYAERWFEPETAENMMNCFEDKEIYAYLMQPFYQCDTWKETRNALRICLNNEYAYEVLKKNYIDLKASGLFMKAVIKKNYFLIFCYYMNLKIRKLIHK